MSATRTNQDLLKAYLDQVHKILVVGWDIDSQSEKRMAYSRTKNAFFERMGYTLSEQNALNDVWGKAHTKIVKAKCFSRANTRDMVTKTFCEEHKIDCDPDTLNQFASKFLSNGASNTVAVPTQQQIASSGAATSVAQVYRALANAATTSSTGIQSRQASVTTVASAIAQSLAPLKQAMPISASTSAEQPQRVEKRKADDFLQQQPVAKTAKAQTTDEIIAELKAVEDQITRESGNTDAVVSIARHILFLNQEADEKEKQAKALEANNAVLTSLGNDLEAAVNEVKGLRS